jgi:ADP-ribose pyrophosphatase
MSSANMALATVKVELKDGDELKDPESKPDEGEHIVKKVVPVADRTFRTPGCQSC